MMAGYHFPVHKFIKKIPSNCTQISVKEYMFQYLQVVIYSNNMRNACRGDKDWIVPCSKYS